MRNTEVQMLNYKQFKYLILIPALESVGLNSPNAVQLLLATMANESAFGQYFRQVTNSGYGPARGVFEMEENTYNDVVKNFLSKELKAKIMVACNCAVFPDVSETIWDLRFSCIMARVFYLRVKEPLPDANDIEGIWRYYKLYWNSNLGSATHGQFMDNYNKFINPNSHV